MLKMDLQRALLSPSFLVGMGVCLCGLLFGASDSLDTMRSWDALSLFNYAYESNNTAWFFVVGSCIPFAGSLCSDRKSGFSYLERRRSSARRMVASRVVAVAVSGGLAVMVSCLLFWVFCAAFTEQIVDTTWGSFASLVGAKPYVEWAARGNVAAYLALYLAAQFFFGAFWSVIGLAASSFSSYGYIACVAPFLLYTLGIQLNWFIDIPLWANPSLLAREVVHEHWAGNIALVAVIYGLLMALASLVLWRRAEKE